MSKSASFKFIPRLSAQRGYVDHGWLHSYHSFSFASYYDSKHMGFGPLRVINEDNIAKNKGFDTHPHSEFEIWTYVVSGELTHKDSLGNLETMKRGDIQYTSAGTGIAHSEYNDNKFKDCHILQIWSKPSIPRLKPTYYTRHHNSTSKTNVLKHIIKPRDAFEQNAEIPLQDGKDELIPVPGDLNFYASVLPNGQSVSHKFLSSPNGILAKNKIRLGYLHLVMTSGIRSPSTAAPEKGASLRVTAEDGTEAILTEGDALKIEAREGGEISIESVGEAQAELVFFDMGDQK